MSKFAVKWSDNEEKDQVAIFPTYDAAKTWIKNQTMQDRYNPTGFDCSAPEEMNEDQLIANGDKVAHGFALQTAVDGKKMFLNFSPSLPYLTEFPYSINEEPFDQQSLDLLSKPPFGTRSKVSCVEVEYLEKDAEKFFKQGGIPVFKVISKANETELITDNATDEKIRDLRVACVALADDSKKYARESFGALSDWAVMPVSDEVAGTCEIANSIIAPGRNIDCLNACIKNLKTIQSARDTKLDAHKECSVWLSYLGELQKAIQNKSEAMKKRWLSVCVDDIYDKHDRFYAMLNY